ncbi:MAG: hypothetical protein WA876_11130 [Candidatus Acidiferrales bacterium]
MTFEKKCFITPNDILAVRFKCVDCKATRTIPIDKLGNAAVHQLMIQACPHCHKDSNFPLGTAELQHFHEFNLILSRLSEILKGRNVEYGFEISVPEDAI